MSVAIATRGMITPAGGTGTKYRMRGRDGGLSGAYAYWTSSEIDGDGSDYPGPGPLTDIVVQAVIGPPAA